MSLEIEIQKKDVGVYVVDLIGSLDSNTYKDFEYQLKPILVLSTKALVLNFSNLSYISSMGVSILFSTKKILEERGANFIMTNLQPQIKKVFEIINALPSMLVFGSLEEADAYLTEIQRRTIEGQE